MKYNCVLTLAFFSCLAAQAWEDHFRITQALLAGSRLPQLEKLARYQSIDEALKDHPVRLGDKPIRSRAELNAALKIQRQWAYPTQLGEKVGWDGAPASILAHYSDEPDWGVDQNLFEADQYPELWREDLNFICFKSGPKSQGFRHMRFPAQWRWQEPIGSVQIPMRPLGEAHQRAAIFAALAKQFFAAGENYWGWRFLAWSLHFVQDLFQPFHSRQTPSKAFIQWRFGWLPFDIAATGEVIGYYHYGYEKWMNQALEAPNSPLRPALVEQPEISPVEPLDGFVADEVVGFAARYAHPVASAAIAFFPAFDPKKLSSEAAVAVPGWIDSFPKEGPRAEKLFSVTTHLFRKMGSVCRGWISSAMH